MNVLKELRVNKMVNFLDDEEKELNAQAVVPVEPQLSARDQLYKNLTEKYGLDARNKVLEENKKPEGFNWRAFGAGLGTTLQGKGAQGTQDLIDTQTKDREGKIAAFDKNKQLLSDDLTAMDKEGARSVKADPMSSESKLAQDLAKRMLPSYDFSKMSAEQIEARFPVITKLYETDAARAMKERELQAKATGVAKPSVGQQTLDREFAKDYNEWTSGGSKTARNEMAKLQGVVDRLKGGETSTGIFSGLFPDRLTSNDLLSARSDVQSTVMNSLRAILGAQFTEKEGERIIKNTWNEADATENNIKRLERLVGDLGAQAESKDAKSKFFNEHGTLAGFTPSLGGDQPTEKTIANKQYSKSRNKTKIIYADGTEEIVDGKQ